jgi:hypothetical protein
VAALPAPAGPADRIVVWLLPAGALVASRLIYTWFAAPAHLVVSLGGWLLFAAVLGLLTRGRDRYPLCAAVGGAALLRTVILLVALARRGPGRYWLHFWIDPTLRSVYLTVAFAAFCWVFVAAWFVLRDAYRLPLRRAAGRLLLALGVPLALLAGLVSAFGLEQALTWWNDQMVLLPWGLHRILGITVYLGIPPVLPVLATLAGLAVAAAGAALLTRWRLPARWRSTPGG